MDLFIPIFLAALVLAIKPGPYMMAVSSLAIEGRAKSIIIFWLGCCTAGTIAYFLLLGSLTLLPPNFSFIFIFIKATAALLFITMGLNSLNASISEQKESSKETKEKITSSSFFQTISSGFLLTFSNPYDILFIITAIPALAGTTSFSILDILVIRGAVISADILVLSAYCIPLLMIRKFFSNDLLRRINMGTSLLMIGIGLYIFYSVLTQWDLYGAGLLG